MIFPDIYATKPNPPATITEGIIAKPSNPSVRFTALLDPTITKREINMNDKPNSKEKFLKNGSIRLVS